ncbi:Glyoxalase-like domain [Pragia fontium]|uniref:Catechol 2,3-dioxygenase n=2 Tax=Pragia fontium TaxID=82985 RepID=A0AAJ5BFM6_9GAMM|nr:VOC family protein [Pragia fontium]AKJ41504.1 glyoxalase [Pragia fontium]GKX63064.1 lactoylglutathione lyase [Pragia fontium]SFB96511.1 Catechol 2,3-dioxygenase [Pragia fontium DSM 5563 = ATCC 49100]SUB81766.1 Glyoxalase-like domain [Pragia fontium]
MVKFGYTIVYVDDVEKTLHFFNEAFDMKTRFLHDTGTYGELDTGETVLAFASHDLGNSHFPDGYISASTSEKPLGIEIALITENVQQTHNVAIVYGSTELKAPAVMPWGQTVSYIRTPSGILIELCSPMA